MDIAVVPAGIYQAHVGRIRETRTHEDGRLTGIYLDWEFVIDGGEFDGVKLQGRTGTALVMYSRLLVWTSAALGTRVPMGRHERDRVFNAVGLHGRRVRVRVTHRADGDGGVRNWIDGVMPAG